MRLNIITLTVSIHFNNNYSLVAHSFSFRIWFSLFFLCSWLAFSTTFACLNEKLHRICGHTNVVYTQQLLYVIFFFLFFISFFFILLLILYHFLSFILLEFEFTFVFFVVLFLGSWTDNLACECILRANMCHYGQIIFVWWKKYNNNKNKKNY